MSRNWAICIGINEYDYFQDLNYAVQDAAAMQAFCRDEVQFEKVYYFADDAAALQLGQGKTFKAQPTSDNLENFLFDRFEKKFLEPEDNLWFFFAGHGKQINGRDYLLPSNANPRNIERPGLAIRNIADRLRRSGAGNVVMFIDACRSEGSRDGRGVGDEKQQGVVTMFSCSPSEVSYEIDALKQGAFTHALLQGLRINGEGNCATVERLDQHLKIQVPNLCKTHGKVDERGNALQMPYTKIEPISKSHLILLAEKANLADVNALKLDAQEAELENEFDLAEELWTRVLAASRRVDPQAIKGLQRIAVRRANLQQNQLSPPPQVAKSQVASSRQSSIETPPEIVELVEPEPPPTKIAIPTQTFSFETVKVNDRGKIVERNQGEAEYYPIDLGNGVTLDLVKIPAGIFMMGCPDGEEDEDDSQKPQHKVTLKEFWLGKYPVTQTQWQRVVMLPKVERDLNSDPAHFKGDNRPIERVNWLEVKEFCERLSQATKKTLRLPSEAEWEYACRAGTTTPFYFGKTISSEIVNYDGNYIYGDGVKGKYREETTPVGQFPPNAWGLYDMHGNVWEWCQDDRHDNYQDAPDDGSVWESASDKSTSKVLRGGSWLDYPWLCRSAIRLDFSRDFRYYFYGFRVACSLPVDP
ncbi:Sulphatase-modifying factor protein [[Leptolyngbya] sp. PCC 7376]|uniref:SUMF1/EgtB/PvdO family nonheme iron enzyme n=1 Tax=[Leptolyngbya] sp. PCC 7376 TaxID=111781 RepID=UPI00029F4B55|nr:SUMF1/EgtB/PvdO family nonheme iron enzyme [[Leptolyngbya] sp. PCC 7376]AFY39355.1 Sulphatase-modifying factor protein [[Leptolyngbya] sp. PCC 7376]